MDYYKTDDWGIIIMGLLKNDINKCNELKGKLATVLSNMLDLNVDKAELFVGWCMDKSALYNKALLKKQYPKLPNNIQRGDIVMCELGINVPPEFGNDGTGRHFVVVWSQQGHNFIVIPITKQAPPEGNVHTIELGKIEGMPAKCNYAKLDAIRTVSIRRLGRVIGQKDGKIVNTDVRVKINNAILDLFVDK